MRSAFSGLRHPASASCLGRHLRLAGRCPNNSSLFPPLAAVVVVALGASSAEKLFLIEQCRSVCGRSGIAFSRVGLGRKTAFAAPLSAKARRCGKRARPLSQALSGLPALPKGEPLAWRENFRQSRKLCRWERSPGGAVAQRLRGYKSAEPEKTVKRSSRRTGVNLQFFPVQPTPLGLKGASSPFFVAPARRNRWHFSGSLLVSKENIPGKRKLPLRRAHSNYFSAFAISGSPRASTFVSSACTFALVASVTASTSE